MPPRTRGNKRTLKENVEVVQTKSKCDKVRKPSKKALVDKTNSVSEDNASNEGSKKVARKATESKLSQIAPRSRRERRLPIRYVENDVLKNLSNNKNDTDLISNAAGSKSKQIHTPGKKLSFTTSPNKRSQSYLESSLIVNKPKRVSCLPSGFDDPAINHSNEPNIKPCHASTPLLQNKRSATAYAKDKNKVISKVIKGVSKKTDQTCYSQNTSDSNNNAKRRLLRNRKEIAATAEKPLPVEHVISPIKKTGRAVGKKLAGNNFSFKVLENKKKSSKRDSNNLDIYEFTYDPNEEPPPAKKRKRIVRKKPTQTRKVVYKNTYDKNVAKALAALKNVVSKKTDVPETIVTTADRPRPLENKQTIQPSIHTKTTQNKQTAQANIKPHTPTTTTVNNPTVQLSKPTSTVVIGQIKPNGLPTCATSNADVASTNQTVSPTLNKNYNSVRVEDIAADFEIIADEYDDINYSPVNSPHCAKTPETSSVHNKDPLNLQDDLDFFADHPVASSSMNMSSRHVQASPWRVEFNNLPIKWPVNSYVKPNMTPAVESSFMNFDEKRKKHVYTNMLAGEDEAVPEIESNNPSNLKQTSIISFIREVAVRSAKKKKQALSVTPTKQNSIFDDVTNVSVYSGNKTPKKVVNNMANDNNINNLKNAEHISSSLSDDKENSNVTKDHIKKKNRSTPKEKNGTFFGFDDTVDQENVSPEKIGNPKVRALRPCSRAVLQEINAMTGPMRAGLPVAAKSKIVSSSDIVNKVYEEKTAADAPVFPEKSNREGGETNIAHSTCNSDVNDDDAMSVHLFEDIELVHHRKPSRKSYGKAKKVTFQQTSSSDTDNLDTHANESSDQDDLSDLTFRMPCVQQKKPKKKSTKKNLTKKQKMSRKEEQEMEVWAAGFNSMCEEIEDFPLVME